MPVLEVLIICVYSKGGKLEVIQQHGVPLPYQGLYTRLKSGICLS